MLFATVGRRHAARRLHEDIERAGAALGGVVACQELHSGLQERRGAWLSHEPTLIVDDGQARRRVGAWFAPF